MPTFVPQNSSGFSDEEYQQYILQGVSRTFALTIPELPPDLRLAIGNAYLICRIADTIEDDEELSPEIKAEYSRQLVEVMDSPDRARQFSRTLYPALSRSTPDAERDLIRNLHRVVRMKSALSGIQHRSISRCVAIMAEGMTRYQFPSSLEGLEDVAALEDYCYYVAGVVGEMLTELFSEHSVEIREHNDALMSRAVSFGLGLQMTNILKDIWDDRKRNICWLPRSVFARRGIELSRLEEARETAAFADGIDELVGIAHGHLRNALEYTLTIPAREKGIRRFCLWSLGLAVLSLRRIHRTPGYSSAAEVKLSRRTLRSMIMVCNLSVSADPVLRFLFNRATAGLPDGDRAPAAEAAVREVKA